MADHTRKHFNLTQERLASWLGMNRTSLALSETRQRDLPLGFGVQLARLELAALGQVLGEKGTTSPAPPPLPAPLPDPGPLEARLAYCRYHAGQLRRALERMRRRAAPYEARLAALPALRAWTGPVDKPDHEKNWLALFEAEAVAALANECGAGSQRLLAARLAGLEHEAALLEAMRPSEREQAGQQSGA